MNADPRVSGAQRIRRTRSSSTRGTCSTSAHGRYTAYLRVSGKLTLMRLPDGVHYTDAAGDLVARDVLDRLRRGYVLR